MVDFLGNAKISTLQTLVMSNPLYIAELYNPKVSNDHNVYCYSLAFSSSSLFLGRFNIALTAFLPQYIYI